MRATCIAVMFTVCILVAASPLEALIIAVNGTNDELTENSYCSLREAIRAAIEEDSMWSVAHGCVPGDGDDTIILPAGRYNLSLGQLEIIGDSYDLKIEPASSSAPADSVIFDGWDNHRLVYVGFQTGDVTFERITFTNGWAADYGTDRRGGALLIEVVEVFLDTCVVDSNVAEKGGGIYSYESILTIDDSSFSNNYADAMTAGTFDGGAIYADNSIIHANNSTFSYNTADLNGGALYLNPISTAWLRHVTITDCNCGFGDFTNGDGGGIFMAADATLNIAHTIIAGNYDLTNGDTKDPDCAGLFGEPTSYNFNIVGDNSDCQITALTGDHFGTAGNLVDPGLEALTTNSKGTTNHLPRANGLAVGSGTFSIGTSFHLCDGSGDQRGVTRPKCVNDPMICFCDIGAVELSSADFIFVDGFESGGTSAWD